MTMSGWEEIIIVCPECEAVCEVEPDGAVHCSPCGFQGQFIAYLQSTKEKDHRMYYWKWFEGVWYSKGDPVRGEHEI